MEIKTASGHVILVDDDDCILLSGYSWWACKSSRGGRLYACARILKSGYPGKRIKMHRLLMNPPAGMVVHHKNNNGLDNRRSNLEITTHRRNILYAFEHKEGGVHFHKKAGKWRAQLKDPRGKPVSLGMYATRKEALAVADKFKSETRT